MTPILHWLALALRTHPELALFLTLAAGHLLGRLRIGPLRLNPVIGVLLAGVAVGQIGIQVPDALAGALFLLFLFSIGYKTGPQFFGGLGRGALAQAGLAVLLCLTALATTYLISRFLGFSAGTAAGLLAGGLNASGAVGTANDAIAKLATTEDARRALAANVTIAFAVTYLVGLVTAIFVLVRMGPWLMRIDLRSECKKLEDQLGMHETEPGVVSAYMQFVMRAYRVPEELHNKTVGQMENAFAPDRVFVERVRTTGGVMDADPDTVLQAGDVVVLSGRSRVLGDRKNPLQQNEVDDPALLDVQILAVDHILRRKDLLHRTIGEINEILGGNAATRGVFIRKVMRAGCELPLGMDVALERGDVLTLVGATTNLERATERLGPVEKPSAATDIVVLGMAIAIGGLIGLPALHFAGFDLGLSLPVGVLLGGLVAGWVHSVHPPFGRTPGPAIWLLDSMGLTGFLAAVAIGAGPSFVNGVRTSGFALLVSGFIVCAVPNIITILVGRYLLRLHPGILLGICAGGGTSPAALAAVQEAADSRVPTLGYGVSYAVGNVLLALWGSVIVALMHGGMK